METEKILVIRNMAGGIEIIEESQYYRFGFWSDILGVYDTREEAQLNAPDDDN